MTVWSVAVVLLSTLGASPAASLCPAVRGDGLALFGLVDDAAIVEGRERGALCKDGAACIALSDDPMRRAPPRLVGGSEVWEAAGRWDDLLVAGWSAKVGEGRVDDALELRRGHWRSLSTSEGGWRPSYSRLAAAAPSTGRGGAVRVVGVVEMSADGARATARQLLAAPPRARVVELEPRRATLLAIPANEEPVALLPLPSGETFVLATRVEHGDGRAIVHRLRAGARPGVAEPLPSPCGASDATAIAGRSARDVYATFVSTCGKVRASSLARFDGRVWSLEPGPLPPAEVSDLAVGADGAVWLAAGDALYRRPPSGSAWTRIPMASPSDAPGGCRATRVVAHGAGALALAVCKGAGEGGRPAVIDVVYESPCRGAPALDLTAAPPSAPR